MRETGDILLISYTFCFIYMTFVHFAAHSHQSCLIMTAHVISDVDTVICGKGRLRLGRICGHEARLPRAPAGPCRPPALDVCGCRKEQHEAYAALAWHPLRT